ncbi:2Fe-2S iron-sulfur cluster-binding protein [uncultured Sphingomonas sp.]|uniref:2Fe-2S iron-sulfur cluster-binding protein n=1 Tax=uncultured Sphingomonas sp. TaxID=158754 RepID=UPI0025F41FEE|nr:2Fe-2S iron-sulfur cluster-binding protein [uncultured Sphingomonas sp.]
MTKINFRRTGGETDVIDAEDGDSVMFAAVQQGVDGIAGECGGVLSCATCHVFVAPEWLDRVGPPGEDEEDMLEATAVERRANSRLSCQIAVSPELDGLTVEIPPEQ